MILDRTVSPAIKPMSDFNIQQPERTVMRNGMPLNIINAGTEDVVRFDILIKGGQWGQDCPLQAMFTNRMLREGTLRFSSAEIAEKLDYYGAWLDLSSSVNYGFVTLYSMGKFFPQTIEILASMLKEPVFPEKELSVVTAVNKQQFRVNAERVDVMARKALNRELFGKAHPLGRYAELDDYDRMNRGLLQRFYRKHYHSSNVSGYVSGKVTPEIIKCIHTHFGDAPWGDTSCIVKQQDYLVQQTEKKRVFVEKEDALQSSLRMGILMPDWNHPDYLKLRVMVTLFGGYFGSRLMSNIREDKGYTYSIGSGLVSYPGTGVMLISTEAANEYVESIISEVYKEIDLLCNEKPSEQELEMVRNYMLGDVCRSYESAISLSDAWIYTEISGLSDDFFNRSIEAIRETTSEDICRLAQTYLVKERMLEVVAGKNI